MSPLLKNSIILLSAKRKMLREMGERLDTLVVGSSHGDFGFDPKYCPGSFNLCCRSQDLKHSYLLYKRMTETVGSIKTLVIFYSVFSPGNFLERSPGEKDISLALNEIFGLGIQYEDPYLCDVASQLKGRLADVSIDLDGHAGFLPTTEKGFFPESYGPLQRASDHLKLNRDTSANVYLMNMLLLAQALGHKVVIVIPPVREDYKAACSGGFDYLFEDLLLIVEMLKHLTPVIDAQLLNCFESDEFDNACFGDFDHLLPLGKGVEKLSSKIYDAIGTAGPSANVVERPAVV